MGIDSRVARSGYRFRMAIPRSEIDQVREATDLVALVSESVALKRVGVQFRGSCPFHGEKTPSFYVSPQKLIYHCYGCQVTGDAIKWVRETQHLDFMDAIRLLADRAGITLHDDSPAGPGSGDKKLFMDAMARAVDWYHEQLLQNPQARPVRAYLKTRGIDGEIARQFKIGWAPDGWDPLSSALDLSAKQLEGTGLGFVNKAGRKQDFVRDRIIFPISDPTGKPIAIGGRVMPNAPVGPDGTAPAKYKNSPETPIYTKRKTLYGLHLAKQNIVQTGEIIVCEGYTDVIAFFQAGLPRAVATCGTALGEEHFRTMKNFASRIVLAYDGDSAGQKAAASVYQWEKQHEVDVAVAKFPPGVDPAELALQDPEALRQAIAEAVPFLKFRLNRVLEAAKIDTPESRARTAEQALPIIAEHPSNFVRDEYLREVADTLQLDLAMLRSRLDEVFNSPRKSPENEVPQRPIFQSRTRTANLQAMPRPGIEALRTLINQPELIRTRLIGPHFVNEIQREAFEVMSSGVSVVSAMDDLQARDRDEAASLLGQVAIMDSEQLFSPADVSAVISQLIRSAAAEELKAVDRELRDGSIDPTTAMHTIRDVKERLTMLDGPHGALAEQNLSAWLAERNGVSAP